MKSHNTIIVGGGASGMLAAIELDDKKSLLVEKNSQLGRKILITGGGRCNITNKAPIKEFIRNYNGNGNYYRGAFNQFFNDDIIKLLEDNGCMTKIEKKKQVFPTTDNAKDVNDTLITLVKKSNTKYELNCNIVDITKEDNYFILKTATNKVFKAENVVLATGSDVYKNTGSTGDGEKFATKLGHTKPDDIVGRDIKAIDFERINSIIATHRATSLERLKTAFDGRNTNESAKFGKIAMSAMAASNIQIAQK